MPKIDTETGERSSPEEIRESYLDHIEILQFFQHIDSKFVTMSVAEYHDLPNYVKEAWTVYRNIKTQLMSAKE